MKVPACITSKAVPRRCIHGKPAQRGRRSRRQTQCPLSLHDDPELGQQHLQPGHQTCLRVWRCHHGMGRRKPGQQADDEISRRSHDGTGRSRRDPFDRVSPVQVSIRMRVPNSFTPPRIPPARSSARASARTGDAAVIAAWCESNPVPTTARTTSFAMH